MSGRPKVLVTADGPHLRDPLVAVRALDAGGYRASIALACPSSIAQHSRSCEGVHRVPGAKEPGYAEAVNRIVEQEGYLTVLPASEAGLLALGGGKPHLVDKVQLAEAGERVGIPGAPTRVAETVDEQVTAAASFGYPVILKPVVHTAVAQRCDDEAQVRAAAMDGPVMVQPFLTERLSSVCGVMWRGRMVAAVHEDWFRTWRTDSGVASHAVTVEPDRALEDRLIALMEGYEGLFNAQFIGPYLIDLNLRLSTTLPLSVKAGANLVAIWCDILRGVEVGEVRARPGVWFRWLEGDVRAIAVAVRRKTLSVAGALRALRPHAGSAHATESMRDPKPMVARLAYIAGKAAGRTG